MTTSQASVGDWQALYKVLELLFIHVSLYVSLSVFVFVVASVCLSYIYVPCCLFLPLCSISFLIKVMIYTVFPLYRLRTTLFTLRIFVELSPTK